MISEGIIINFASVLSLIRSSYIGDVQCGSFIGFWPIFSQFFENVVYIPKPKNTKEIEVMEELAKIRKFDDFDKYKEYFLMDIDGSDSDRQCFREAQDKIIKLYVDAIKKISNLCLNSNLDREIAESIFVIYSEIIEQIVPLKILNLSWHNHPIADRICTIEEYFKLWSSVFNNQEIRHEGIKSFVNEIDESSRADQLIIESLTTLFLYSISIYFDDSYNYYETFGQELISISKRFESALCPHRGILLNRIFKTLRNVRQSVYQGLIYYFLMSNKLSDKEYNELVSAVKEGDFDVFSRIVNDCNLHIDLLKYYDLLLLVYRLSDFRPNHLSGGPDPEKFFNNVVDFYARNSSSTNSQMPDISRIAACNVILYHELKKLCDRDLTQLVFNLINSDDLLKERFSFYERVYHLQNNPSSEISKVVSTSIIKEQGTKNDDTSYLESSGSERVFNCKYPEKVIDDFLNYLVWRGYIKEGDQSSFKYYVFGGPKPSDYRDVSFSFERSLSGSTMLGVIVWQLRKENPQLVELFNKTINKANCNIGTNNESMRIFVDLSLFFPSLWLRIRDTNKKEENRLIEKNLKKQVQKLKGNDDYINCSSILEFIKQHESQNPNYWVVGKKLDD